MNLNSPKTSHMASVKIDKGYQTVSMFFCESERILWKEFWPVAKSTFQKTSPWSVYQSICMKKNKNICPWLVNWNVQYSAGLWNVSGGRLQFWECLQIKCSHGASFNKKTKMTDDQKASVYHVATAGVRFSIWYNRREYFKNIFKYFCTEFETP